MSRDRLRPKTAWTSADLRARKVKGIVLSSVAVRIFGSVLYQCESRAYLNPWGGASLEATWSIFGSKHSHLPSCPRINAHKKIRKTIFAKIRAARTNMHICEDLGAPISGKKDELVVRIADAM